MAACKVCGKEAGYFPICRSCNQLKDKGEVVKCEKCGSWKKKDEECCKNTKDANVVKVCLTCDNKANNGPLCISCYKQKESSKKEFEKDRSLEDIREHYYRQKTSLYKVRNRDYLKNGILRLIALSEDAKLYHNDFSLKKRVENDITKLYENVDRKKIEEDKKPIKHKKKNSFNDVDYRTQWPAQNQCDDGHYVRSYSEMLIDNWLYNNDYVHAYEKSVFIESEPEAVVLSDFYLPQGDVYIEFWGMNDDETYKKRKEKKIKYYEVNKINMISLEEKDIKRLNDIMPRKLHEFLKSK